MSFPDSRVSLKRYPSTTLPGHIFFVIVLKKMSVLIKPKVARGRCLIRRDCPRHVSPPVLTILASLLCPQFSHPCILHLLTFGWCSVFCVRITSMLPKIETQLHRSFGPRRLNGQTSEDEITRAVAWRSCRGPFLVVSNLSRMPRSVSASQPLSHEPQPPFLTPQVLKLCIHA